MHHWSNGARFIVIWHYLYWPRHILMWQFNMLNLTSMKYPLQPICQNFYLDMFLHLFLEGQRRVLQYHVVVPEYHQIITCWDCWFGTGARRDPRRIRYFSLFSFLFLDPNREKWLEFLPNFVCLPLGEFRSEYNVKSTTGSTI